MCYRDNSALSTNKTGIRLWNRWVYWAFTYRYKTTFLLSFITFPHSELPSNPCSSTSLSENIIQYVYSKLEQTL